MARTAARLPGSAAAYRVPDLEASEVDNAPPLRVPEGRLYVLGDNRDDAVDSRLTGRIGPGMVALADVYGIVEDIKPGAFALKPPPEPSNKQPPQFAPSQ